MTHHIACINLLKLQTRKYIKWKKSICIIWPQGKNMSRHTITGSNTSTNGHTKVIFEEKTALLFFVFLLQGEKDRTLLHQSAIHQAKWLLSNTQLGVSMMSAAWPGKGIVKNQRSRTIYCYWIKIQKTRISTCQLEQKIAQME